MHRLTPLCAVAVAVLLAAAAGCSAKGSDDSSAPGKGVTFGVLAPLSGPHAEVGRQVVDGAEQAAAELNVQGGVIGVPVKVVAADDKCTAVGAKQAAARLSAEPNLGGVLGGVCDAAAAAAARAFAAQRIPFLVSGANDQAIVDQAKAPSTYLLNGTPYQQSLAVAHWLAIKNKQFLATVSERTGADEFLMRTLTYLTSPTPKLVSQQRVAPGARDMTAVAKTVLAAKPKPDVVYFAGSPGTSGRLVASLRAAGYKGTYVASARSRSPAFLAAAGRGAQGAFVVAPAQPQDLLDTKDWAAQFRQTYGRAPGADAMQSYDALRVLGQAVTQTGKVDHPLNSEQLPGIDFSFETFLGGVQFARDHTIQQDNHIIVVADKGAFKTENTLRSQGG